MKLLFLREGPGHTTALPYNLIRDSLREYKLKLERDLEVYSHGTPIDPIETRAVRDLQRKHNSVIRLLEKLT